MRISTNQLFDASTATILRNQSATYRIQNQIATGRRVQSPEDDPVAAAQVLVTQQSRDINTQFIENQGVAKSQLGLLEGQLESLGNVLHNIRERAVQLGNAALTDRERASIATDLEQRFAEMVSIANAQNSQGQYLFSGFQGSIKPFAVNSPPGAAPHSAGTATIAANPYMTYAGDDGERVLQVDSSRRMSISAAGSDVFMNIKQGNGTFATAANVGNTGTGTIDQGSVIDVAKWNNSNLQPQNFRIDFQLDNSGATPVLKYNLINVANGNSLFTNAAPGPVTAAEWKVYTPGQAITFSGLDAGVVAGGDLGVQVIVSGTPAAGDSFDVAASQNQSMFDTLKNLIAEATEAVPKTATGNSRLANRLGEALANLDQGLDNVSKIRATVGSRLAELDSLGLAAADKNLQYESRISELQDVDMAAAISELSKRQLQLEASQRTFVRITSLNLFDLL